MSFPDKPDSVTRKELAEMSSVTLKQHKSTHNSEKQSKNRHQISHNPQAWFECTVCGRNFARKYAFDKHIKYGSMCVSNQEKQQYLECEICGKHFPRARSYDMKLHKYQHTGEKPYPCRICGKRFTRPTTKNKHELSHDLESSEVWFECKMCDRKFGQEEHLEEHILSSHAEKEPLFECDICGECFTNMESKVRHERFHDNSQNCLECTTCGLTFVTKFRLKKHMRTHDKKPGKKLHFECKICGKKYLYGKSFMSHLSKPCVIPA